MTFKIFYIFQSNPEIYESPRMFRHGNDLYLIARTDPNGQFWSKDNSILNLLPDNLHHLIDLGRYSLRSHGTAIWKVNQEKVSKYHLKMYNYL